jgi:hypothetical protein
METQDKTGHKRSWLREFFSLGEVGGYFFRKKDPNKPKNFTLGAMHIINKIAILMFLVCVIIILKRYFFGH